MTVLYLVDIEQGQQGETGLFGVVPPQTSRTAECSLSHILQVCELHLRDEQHFSNTFAHFVF